MRWHRETHINPTKEPINYRGPSGDRTPDLQTEATPPAASCPARTLHATEIAPKNATPMTCPWLHWTTDNLSGMHMVSISTPVCVKHTYIHTYIFIRGFALAQGTFLLVNFAWICCDGLESQLRNGYLLKCDRLFDCNWHIGMIKWEIKIDILGWRDRGGEPSTSRVTGRCLIHYTSSDSVNYVGFTRTLSSVNIKSTNFEEKIIPGI